MMDVSAVTFFISYNSQLPLVVDLLCDVSEESLHRKEGRKRRHAKLAPRKEKVRKEDVRNLPRFRLWAWRRDWHWVHDP
jgi:hypothetical protein